MYICCMHTINLHLSLHHSVMEFNIYSIWSYFIIGIQDCVISVQELDLLISQSDFVISSLKTLRSHSFSAQSACLHTDVLLLAWISCAQVSTFALALGSLLFACETSAWIFCVKLLSKSTNQ